MPSNFQVTNEYRTTEIIGVGIDNTRSIHTPVCYFLRHRFNHVFHWFLFFFLCKDCSIGFYGYHPVCKQCPFPSYGPKCQSICVCPIKSCNHITGCISSKPITGTFCYYFYWCHTYPLFVFRIIKLSMLENCELNVIRIIHNLMT